MECSCRYNRKGGSACQRRLGRHYESVVSIERTERTLATFSVDIIFKVGTVERTVSCPKNRKGGSACQRRLGRHYESVVSIEKTSRTLATFSVDITLKVGRVRRNAPVARTGKVLVPVDVDLVGSS
jgi:hypothetical protein